jgi:hypothetical protein
VIGKARDEKPHAPVQKVDEKSEKPEKFSKPKGKENAKNPLAHSGGGLCFLFEVTENKARSVLVKEKNGTVEVLNVEIFPDESYRNFQREMVWSEFSQWVKKVTTEKSQGQRFDTKVLLTGHGVYVDVVDRPDVSVKEMKDNIAFQVAENIPFTLDDSLLRYELTEDTALAATVDPEFREKVLSGFHEAGIYPLSISLLPFSYQALVKKHKVLSQKTFLLVHMARHHTYLIHFYQGKFHSIRELSIGGEHVTQAMIGTLMLDEQSINIGYEEAKILKEKLGIPTKNLEVIASEPKNSQLSMRIRPIFDRLIADIAFSLKQFQLVFPAVEVHKILLSGGGSQMKGLENFMTDRLGYVTEGFILDDISASATPSEAHLLGMLFLPLERFNFAGVEDILKPNFEKIVVFLKRGICALLVVMLLLIAVAWGKKTIAQVRLKNLKESYVQLGATDEKMLELDKVIMKIGSLNAARRSEIKEEPSLGKVLKELSQLVPRAIKFQSINFEKNPEPQTIVKGLVEPGRQSQDIVLSGFIESLEGSLYFEQTKLESRSPHEADPEQIEFLINTRLVNS